MSTLRERLEQACKDGGCINDNEYVFKAVKQELLTLAHEIEHKKVKPNEFLSTAPFRAGQSEIAYNNALSLADKIIRSKVNEL